MFSSAHRADPKPIEKVSTNAFMQSVTEFKLRIQGAARVCVAADLLKVAYICVFRALGFVIPESKEAVRKQIANPAQPILPRS